MRKILIVFALIAFLGPGAWVLARDPTPVKQAEPHINCCFQDGQCLRTKRDNCALKKGIVATDCSDCPGVWGKAKDK